MALKWGELGFEGLNSAAGAVQHVALGVAEESQGLLGSWPRTVAFLEIRRQRLQPFALHRPSELALDERLREQSEEVHGE